MRHLAPVSSPMPGSLGEATTTTTTTDPTATLTTGGTGTEIRSPPQGWSVERRCVRLPGGPQRLGSDDVLGGSWRLLAVGGAGLCRPLVSLSAAGA
jgi:hypothetical protein